jgi:uncharacterized Zn finger protein (UPF0148 family)
VEILKNKTCPKCGCPDGLFICNTVGAVNCSDCMQFIRLLSREETEKHLKLLRKKGGYMKRR